MIIELVKLPKGFRPPVFTDERMFLVDQTIELVFGYCPRDGIAYFTVREPDCRWLSIKATFCTALCILAELERKGARFNPHSRVAWIDYVMNQLPALDQLCLIGPDGKPLQSF